VVDSEFLVFLHQSFSLLLELPMSLDHLAMAHLELAELDGLHLVQIHDPSSLGLSLLQPTIQPFQLRGE
jgi:hypothetical protein